MVNNLASLRPVRYVLLVRRAVREGNDAERGSREGKVLSGVDVRSKNVTLEIGVLAARFITGLFLSVSFVSEERLARSFRSLTEVILLNDKSRSFNLGAGKGPGRLPSPLDDKRRVLSDGNDGSSSMICERCQP